jgi:hypothetical protein
MKVEDAGERIFICSEGEDARMEMTCTGTLFGITHVFDPPIHNTKKSDDESGVISFAVSRDTKLIINFHYSSASAGKYKCALFEVEEDADGAFNETVKQFGDLPQRRKYTFLIED